MTPQQFIAKWQAVNLSERSACQQHFLDLCELLSHEKPAAADPEGAWYCFERGVSKTEGGQGWADVWMRGHFGWEYKGKHKDLAAAYKQLLLYRESLENPPLLIVCDMDRFEVHTNFTDTIKRVYDFDLAGLAEPRNLQTLRRVFTDPDALRPGIAVRTVTSLVSEKFGMVADAMRQRKIPPQDVAHFLMKLMFSMFVEDIELLPNRIFTRTLKQSKNVGAKLSAFLSELFAAMAGGGTFGPDEILHFNGGLFADSRVYDLKADEIQQLADAADQDWSSVEPHIFGTLFERLLDPEKRSQIGAHYTSSDDIKTLLEPVMMTPLRREWAEVKAKCEALIPQLGTSTHAKSTFRRGARTALPPYEATSPATPTPGASTGAKSERSSAESADDKRRRQFNKLLTDFAHRLSKVTVLDPACGSGNFLYVALRLLLDLEKEVIAFAANHRLELHPQVRPTQLHGIEINPYAQELASVVIWIGYLQWMRDNGFSAPNNPVLEPIESIERRDAILDLTDPQHPKEPTWPAAEFIVGNPPFLGAKFLRPELGDNYVEALFQVWGDRVHRESDICCYWFEKGRKAIEKKKSFRCGLLATQGIRGGFNRETLANILESGAIFFGVSDRDWVLDGAVVHISMVGFDDGTEKLRLLDGKSVAEIHANLGAIANISKASHLSANDGLYVRAPEKGGKFDLDDDQALALLNLPNPNGRPNSDVVRPWINAESLVQRRQRLWIIDFPSETNEVHASQYEAPFAYLEEKVKEFRSGNSDEKLKKRWWLYRRPGEGVRDAQMAHSRLLVSPMVSKHRIFSWLTTEVQPDKTIIPFARSDDYFLGVLHSRVHEIWARALGTQLRERESGFRYTPTTCFETFPFPEPTDGQREAIAEAARELDRLRANWLNPPEWTREEILEFPGSLDGPWARYIESGPLAPRAEAAATDVRAGKTSRKGIARFTSSARGASGPLGTVRYPRLVPKDEQCAKELKKRTLTNLYNQRPAWLDLAHKKLDEAVFAAYGWPATVSDDQLLARLLELNLARSK